MRYPQLLEEDGSSRPARNFDVICDDRIVKLAFTAFENMDALMGNIVQVALSNVADQVGNVDSAPVSWSFTVGEFDRSRVTTIVSGIVVAAQKFAASRASTRLTRTAATAPGA